MNRLMLIGAGGHAKVVADIALKNGYETIVLADDCATGFCMDFPIICTCAELEEQNDGQTDFVIAIGKNTIRKRIAERYCLPWVTLIHPSAQIGSHAVIGAGSVVMAGAVINPCATVGNHCVVNTCAVVEHDNALSDYVHISPNAALGGTVRIGECTHIGIGATVKNNVSIAPGCIIGAGAAVVKNIDEAGIYVGVPARRLGE